MGLHKNMNCAFPLIYFTPFSNVSLADFELLNVSCVDTSDSMIHQSQMLCRVDERKNFTCDEVFFDIAGSLELANIQKKKLCSVLVLQRV